MIWNLAKSVRPKALVAFLVAWNVLFLAAIWLNEGAGRIRTLGGAVAMTVICSAFAIFAFLAARPGALQRSMLRPDASPALARPGLRFFGLICALLAIGAALMGFSILWGHT